MAPSIDNAFIENYKQLVIHLAQQGEARIRPYVTEEPMTGEALNIERLAPTAAQTKSGRRQDSSSYYVDDVWTRRVVTPSTYVHLMTIENEDKVQMLVDPENAYAANQAMAMMRAYESLIIAAATGNALDGDGDAVALPAGQIVGDGSAAISFDMVTAVQEKFMSNEITMDQPKIAVVGPTQVRKMLQLTEQTSADFVQREALQRLSQYGIVPGWMGFTWIMSNLLTAPDTGELYCLFFTKNAITLGVNNNMLTRIGENPDKLYMWQVFAQFTAGASRVVDEEIVVAHVLDSL
jgi:hypothetical protein